MKRYAVLLFAVLTAAAPSAQTPTVTPFRYERPIQTGGAGPRRLGIDVPLLIGSARPTNQTSPRDVLADLRLFDANGQELQYLLVENPPVDPVWRSAATLPIAPVETPTEKTSGFEIDLGEPIVIDAFRVTGFTPPFLKRVRLEGSGDRTRWTLLVSEGTMFDLPQERLTQTELAFPPGTYRYVRATFDDTRSGRLAPPPSAAVREVRNAAPPRTLRTALTFERRPGEPGRGQYRVQLRAANLPIVALDIDIAGTRILRDATVYEPRLAGGQVVPTALGSSTLRRVVQGDVVAASTTIPITSPGEPALDLVIDEGDNPPSEIRSITAVFAGLPWIYFESNSGTVIARYGQPSLKAPRYDLEALRSSLSIESVAEAAWGEAVVRAESQEISSAAPALPTVGSSLDPATFRYLRPIPSGADGLIAVPLDAAVLAHSAGESFSDVRVLDSSNRQVPYLVERSSEPLSLDLAVEPLTDRPASLPADPAASVYRIRLPHERLPSARLVLTTPARIFTRVVTVGVEHDPDRRQRERWFETVATSSWSHADQESAAPALTINLHPFERRDVFVIVEEGDNSPLPIGSARLLLPSYRLRLFRERDAALRLAYGRDDLTAPRYDLALIAPQLTGVAATEVNPAEEPAAASAALSTAISPRLFWGVLIAAVVILLALVVRLVRKSDVPSAPAA